MAVHPHLSWGPGRRAQTPCSSPLPWRFEALLLQACLPCSWRAQTFWALAGWACSWLAPGQKAWCCCWLLRAIPVRLHLRLHAPRQRTRCPGRSPACLRVGQQQQQMGGERRRRKGRCRAAECGCHTHLCWPFATCTALARCWGWLSQTVLRSVWACVLVSDSSPAEVLLCLCCSFVCGDPLYLVAEGRCSPTWQCSVAVGTIMQSHQMLRQ